jgi:hypothetical protein
MGQSVYHAQQIRGVSSGMQMLPPRKARQVAGGDELHAPSTGEQP